MADGTTQDETRPDQIRQARGLVDFADGMAAPADSHADRLATIALGQARATLAVAEELRALRELLAGSAT